MRRNKQAPVIIRPMNQRALKQSLRKDMRARRAGIAATERRAKDRRIIKNLHNVPMFKEAKSVFCYVSYLSEADTRPIIEDCIRQNRLLAVPRIMSGSRMIAVRLNDPAELRPDIMGIPAPLSSRAEVGPFDIAITPGLAFSPAGERLGYGRGYYDRWFAGHRVHTRIALAYEIQLVDRLPTAATDRRVDMIVTEDRVISAPAEDFERS